MRTILIIQFLLFTSLTFSQKLKTSTIFNNEADSVSNIYSDSAQTILIGTAEYFNENKVYSDSLHRPYKIGYYRTGYDTAFYWNGVKIGYRVEKSRGDEIHPRWISLGTFPRGYTFGINYSSFNQKNYYFEAYAGIFGMLYPNSYKMFSAGLNYTRFFYRKEKPKDLYHAVLFGNFKRYHPGSTIYYQTKIHTMKNIYWGYQIGFTYDQINGESSESYFYTSQNSFQLLEAKSASALIGLTRFVVKSMQLSFGKDGKRKLRGANFRRLSFVMTYNPLMQLNWQQIDEGIPITENSIAENAFFGNKFGWRVQWDGRVAFWGKRDFGFVYRYGIEQTPFLQYGNKGLVPIIAGGIFFNVGKSTIAKQREFISANEF